MKFIPALLAAGLAWSAASFADAQTYNFSSNFTNISGSVSGTFVFDPTTNTVTSANVSVGAGSKQAGAGPIAAAAYVFVNSSNAGYVQVLEGSPAVGARGIDLYFNPDLNNGAPQLVTQREISCTSADCTGRIFTRQGIINAVLTTAPSVSGLSPASGPIDGGTVVTITGTGLTAATSVTFGGVAATTVTVDSATKITATAPARPAGIVDVLVTTPGGTSANTAADNFLYVAPAPVPTLSEWAMILMGTVLAGAAALIVRRRQASI